MNLINYFIITDDNVRQNAIRAISNLPVGQYEVRIAKKERSKTRQQEKFYWGAWLPHFEEWSGINKDWWHKYFKIKALGVTKEKINGVEIIEPKSTKDLTAAEYSEFLNVVDAEGLVHGINLPRAEYHGLSYGGTPSHQGSLCKKPGASPAGTLHNPH